MKFLFALFGVFVNGVAFGATRIDGDMDVCWPLSASPATQHLAFSCIVQSNEWRIVTQAEGKSNVLGHRELAKSGTNLFLVRYMDPRKTTNRVVRAKGSISAYVSNAVPVFLEDFAHIVWMSYCRSLQTSSDYHGTSISSRLLYDMPPTNLSCSVKWSHSDPLDRK